MSPMHDQAHLRHPLHRLQAALHVCADDLRQQLRKQVWLLALQVCGTTNKARPELQEVGDAAAVELPALQAADGEGGDGADPGLVVLHGHDLAELKVAAQAAQQAAELVVVLLVLQALPCLQSAPKNSFFFGIYLQHLW